MSVFLKQTETVQQLIDCVIACLSDLPNNNRKLNLENALKPFISSIATTIINIDSIQEYAHKYQILLDHENILILLNKICEDIEYNCVNDSIKYHVDYLNEAR